MQNKIQTRSMN